MFYGLPPRRSKDELASAQFHLIPISDFERSAESLILQVSGVSVQVSG
jgi:hypothetical protein